MRTSKVATLLIGGALNFATPIAAATSAANLALIGLDSSSTRAARSTDAAPPALPAEPVTVS